MTYKTLCSPDQLHMLISSGNLFIADCDFDLANPGAGRAAFRTGHIPGARYLHLDDELSAPAGSNGRHPLPDGKIFAAALRRAGLRNGMQVVAYDTAGGAFAARLWWLLRWLGYDRVAVPDGGKQSWVAAGYPLEAGEVVSVAGDFNLCQPNAAKTLEVEAIVQNLEERTSLILDGRAPERFAGHHNPLDAVAGHIPGARNRFFKENLAADGRFRPASELQADFAVILDGTPPERVVHQCGSGVTACHNALAMEIAGFSGSRLYAGSWSEWINDPRRPVERNTPAVGGP